MLYVFVMTIGSNKLVLSNYFGRDSIDQKKKKIGLEANQV